MARRPSETSRPGRTHQGEVVITPRGLSSGPGREGRCVVRDPAIGAILDLDADRLDQPPRGGRDVRDRCVERIAIAGARLAEAAHLANELAGGRLQLAGRRAFPGTTQGLDAPAHAHTVRRGVFLRRTTRSVTPSSRCHHGGPRGADGKRLSQVSDGHGLARYERPGYASEAIDPAALP